MSDWTFEIFIDGGCPLCSREARLMARLDRGRGRLQLTDITAPGFDPAAHGIDYDAAMQSIHGRWSDGRIVTGVEVFRAAYQAIGLGWLWAPTGWPGLRQGCDAAYRVFAKRRYARRLRDCNGVCAPAPPIGAAE